MSETNKPVAQVRIGNIKSAVWANEVDGGNTMHMATFVRSYRDDNGDWHDVSSFPARDLLALAKVVDKTHDRMMQLAAEARKRNR